MDRLFPPSTTRLVFHFAATYGPGRVVTMKAESHPGDTTLELWTHDDELRFTKVGEIESPKPFFAPAYDLHGDLLAIYESNTLVRVDLGARTAARIDTTDLQACVFVGDTLHEIRDTGLYANGALLLAKGNTWGHGTYARGVGDRILWATQDGLLTIDTAPKPTVGKRVRIDNIRTVPVEIGDRIAVLEVYDDDSKRSISIVADGKLVSKLYANLRVQAWTVDGGTLYAVVGSQKLAPTLKVVDIANGTELASVSLDSPLTESTEETQAVWCGLTASTFACLVGSGGLIRIPRPQV